MLHRKDGSGTTFVFTEYLSAVSEEWKTRYGADTLITWPLGTGAEGTQNLISAVHATKGAIAYAEYGQVQRAGLPYVSLTEQGEPFRETRMLTACGMPCTPIAWAKTQDFLAIID